MGKLPSGGEMFVNVDIPLVTPLLSAKVAVQASRVLRPVGAFMGERGIEAFGITKRFDRVTAAPVPIKRSLRDP
jgi:hypothetical protein